jgi:ATP-binding cassette subfamily F protein uup
MSLLCSVQSVSKSFGNRKLFHQLSLSIFSNDKIGLIGPNGSGKSTLLKIILGVEKADEGIVSPRRDLKIGYLPQTCEFDDISVETALMEAFTDPEMPDYEKEQLVDMWLSRFGFAGKDVSAGKLSGGWKKRLRLAKELILAPDLLLLDEPTNHLDLEGIVWLEKFLAREAPPYLLVSHDRSFLEHTTNRIIEVDPTYPKGMFATDGKYSEFLGHKEQFLAGQLQQERSMATKMRRETDWLRAGAKARTTKSQARIDDAHEIIEEHSQLKRRNQERKAKIDFAGSERETQKLVVVKNLGKQAGQRALFKHLEFILSPGVRVGLMGPNGSGKTTLLKLIAGEITPDQGTIKRADNLQVVYFDQHRTKLPLEMSLREALSPRGEYVTFRGQPIHVNGWCKRFLFSPDILDLPIGKLSGGERARISIAHLMLQPADVLLLDEPTNDLDIPTLETLEESLFDFPGAVVLITHDRSMLNRICNTLLALGDPEKTEFFPDFVQWEASIEKKSKKEKEPVAAPASAPKPKTGLSYNEKKEYGQIEKKILENETEIQKLNGLLMDESMAKDPAKLQEVCTSIGIAEVRLEKLLLRWEELEKKMQ